MEGDRVLEQEREREGGLFSWDFVVVCVLIFEVREGWEIETIL